jgi:hypothetical protein
MFRIQHLTVGCCSLAALFVACSTEPSKTLPAAPAPSIATAVAGTPSGDALRLSIPAGAPAGEIARQLVLAYRGGSAPLTIGVRATDPGDPRASIVVLDSRHGQVGSLALASGTESQPFVYRSAESSTLTLQLYNWGDAPVALFVAPGDVWVLSDQVNSACAP